MLYKQTLPYGHVCPPKSIYCREGAHELCVHDSWLQSWQPTLSSILRLLVDLFVFQWVHDKNGHMSRDVGDI